MEVSLLLPRWPSWFLHNLHTWAQPPQFPGARQDPPFPVDGCWRQIGDSVLWRDPVHFSPLVPLELVLVMHTQPGGMC